MYAVRGASYQLLWVEHVRPYLRSSWGAEFIIASADVVLKLVAARVLVSIMVLVFAAGYALLETR
jgi:hypothetical protein